MKKNLSILKVAVALSSVVLLASCSSDEPANSSTSSSNEVIINSDITGTRSLVKDSVYVLEGQINVDTLATINIQAGTVIKGDKLTKGCLVVKPGGTINAVGTASEPIVFTSRQAAGLRAAGDWGGVVVCGRATTNQSSKTVEGLSRAVTYTGGTDDADNSGTLQYVRIEFAGIALQPDKEINGLTFCAVGSGTTVDHIQVSFSGDDSYEWFGGTVNAKNLIAYCGLDDDFDTDYGYRGKVQFGLAVRNSRVADVSTSNGFESDNDGSGSSATPQTAPVFSNITMVGPYKTTSDKNVNSQFGAGAHIRRNSSLSVFNSVFAGWNTAGILIDGTSTYANITAGGLVIKNCVVAGTKSSSTALNGAGGVLAADVTTYFNTTGSGNSLLTAVTDAGISASFYNASASGSAAVPTSFLPGTGSPLLSAAAFADTKLSDSFFDNTANYIGAFGTSDWTATWTNFDPQNTIY